ncbi:MAG TPA: ABC transporter permease [Thermodesulfobacteriota bacterium]|nr:ABC transporter permease [Thermodesulfobacteriota bacterium]
MNQTEREMFSKEPIEKPAAPRESRWQEFWRLFRKNRLAFLGLLIFLLFFLTAVTGLMLTSGRKPLFDPAMVRLEEKLRPPLSRPNWGALKPEAIPRLGVYLFGTDDLGRDVFSRMMQGAWVSLTVGFIAVGISVAIGILLGGISGYYGQNAIRLDQMIAVFIAMAGVILLLSQNHMSGILLLFVSILYFGVSQFLKKKARRPGEAPWARILSVRAMSIDTLIMRFVDIMLCFPSFLLILTVVALLPPSIYNIMIVIGLTSWMGTTRFVRAEFLSLREQDFVTAARALGVGDWRIIFRHMVPNAVAPVLVSATIGIASAILTESALSFLGLGVPPPHATWGNILNDGRNYIFDAPWLTFVPGIAILIVVLSFNLFGEGLRDVLNPRLRERS